MDYQPKSHAREPFPWLLIGGIAVLSVVAEVGMAWLVLQLFDCDILDAP